MLPPLSSAVTVSTGWADECAHEIGSGARTPSTGLIVKAKTGSPTRRGRPPFVATDEHRKVVMIGTAAGHTQATMAVRIGINVDTLRKHFRAELDEGTDLANSALGEVLYRKALSGDIKAIENWYDRRGGSGWRKRTASETSGPDGGPIQVAAMPRRDLSHFTTAEVEAFERLTAKLEQGDAATNG